MTLREYLSLTPEQKEAGVFIQGNRNNGEYKRWHSNDQLYIHYFYKDGNLNGEYKSWYSNGQLWEHFLYENGKKIKDYLKNSN